MKAVHVSIASSVKTCAISGSPNVQFSLIDEFPLPSLFQTIFRALVEPIVQCQDQTISEQDVQNGSAADNTEKEDNFKIVFKDTQPVRSAFE